jgi:hypothetical protein
MKDFENGFSIHLFVDNVLRRRPHLMQLPRNGDAIRLSKTEFVEVVDVCWCLDEDSRIGQRVNIGTVSCKKKKKGGKK